MANIYDDDNTYDGDCGIPFEDMSEEEFLYRAMNPDDPMYMGPEISFDDVDDWAGQ